MVAVAHPGDPKMIILGVATQVPMNFPMAKHGQAIESQHSPIQIYTNIYLISRFGILKSIEIQIKLDV